MQSSEMFVIKGWCFIDMYWMLTSLGIHYFPCLCCIYKYLSCITNTLANNSLGIFHLVALFTHWDTAFFTWWNRTSSQSKKSQPGLLRQQILKSRGIKPWESHVSMAYSPRISPFSLKPSSETYWAQDKCSPSAPSIGLLCLGITERKHFWMP